MEYSNLMTSIISRLSRHTARYLEKRLEQQDVSLQEFRIAGLLIGEKDINQKTLAKKLSVQPATLSVAISKMEEKGTLVRKVSATDKRVNLLSLSDDADFSEIDALLEQIEKRALEGISSKDVAIAKKVLNQMTKNLAADTDIV